MGSRFARAKADLALTQVSLREIVPYLSLGAETLMRVIEYVEVTRTPRYAVERVSVSILDLTHRLTDTKVKLLWGLESDRDLVPFRDSSEVLMSTRRFYEELQSLMAVVETSPSNCFLPCLKVGRNLRTLSVLQEDLLRIIQHFSDNCEPTIMHALQVRTQSVIMGREHMMADTSYSITFEDFVDDARVAEDLADHELLSTEIDILDKLPHVDAGLRSNLNVTKSEYLEGTRMELLEQLQAWAEKSTTESIFFLGGAAGTGKSTVASEFARRLDKIGQLGASFFFTQDIQGHDPTHLFTTIAYQLAYSQTGIRAPIIEAVRAHLQRGVRQQMRYQVEDLLLRPLRSIPSDNQPLRPIIIVVDGLDACTEDDPSVVPRMLELLLSCTCYSGSPLRLFLTSRPNLTIEDSLQRFLTELRTVSLHNLAPESVERDVALYIQSRLDRIPMLSSAERSVDITRRMTRKAEGFFFYAQVAMNSLEDEGGVSASQQLEGLLSANSSQTGVLEQLDILYARILKSSFPSSRMHAGLLSRLQLVLGYIALLRDLLSPRALSKLSGVPTEDIIVVLNRLRAIVVFRRDDPDSLFLPVHSTFCDFLVDDTRCTSESYHVDSGPHHAHIAESSLRILLSLSRNMCQLPPIRKASVLDLPDRLRMYVPPEARYACLYWAEHLVLGRGESSTFIGLLESFIDTKLVVWLELMGYMGTLNIALTSLRTTLALEWMPTQVAEPLLQGVQILETNFEEIDEIPMVVYLYDAALSKINHTSPGSSYSDLSGRARERLANLQSSDASNCDSIGSRYQMSLDDISTGSCSVDMPHSPQYRSGDMDSAEDDVPATPVVPPLRSDVEKDQNIFNLQTATELEAPNPQGIEVQNENCEVAGVPGRPTMRDTSGNRDT